MPHLLIFSTLDRARRSSLMITAVLSLAFLNVQAQSTAEVVTLASACLNCHAATSSVTSGGGTKESIPSIVGQTQQVLTDKLLAFKSDSPPAGTTIMNRIAKGYSDEELSSLAIYFSKLTPVAPHLTEGVKK